jgi:hypothetical protein
VAHVGRPDGADDEHPGLAGHHRPRRSWRRQKAGNAAWSPLWDHLTAVWKDESAAVLLTSQAELDERVAAGEIEIFKGTPDTDGQGFVVNCPSPIVAPSISR